jgi:hypothetical protein
VTEILIDGDNLAGWLAQEEYIAHRRDDAGLLRLLRRWQRRVLTRGHDHWVTLVLDPGPNRDHSSHQDQIWVTIARNGGTADGCLLEMLEEDLVMGRPLRDALVVTSDHDLSEQLKAMGVRVTRVPDFARRLVRGLPPRAEKPAPGASGFEDVEQQLLARAARSHLRRRPRPVDTAALMAALEGLTAASVESRIESVQTLGGLPDRRSAMALVEALNDPSPRVRAEAARGLGRLGYRTLARAPLLQRLEDPAPDVREAAATALGRLRDSWAIPALRNLAEMERTTQVRRAAWEALRHISDAQGPAG